MIIHQAAILLEQQQLPGHFTNKHIRAHETKQEIVCHHLQKKNKNNQKKHISYFLYFHLFIRDFNCGVHSVSNDHPSSSYPVGTTTVTWTVTDVHGNTNTATQTVTVTNVAPVI